MQPKPEVGQISALVPMVMSSADLRVQISGVAFNTVTAGEYQQYTVQVLNFGPGLAYDVSLQNILPSGTSFVSMTQIGDPADVPGGVIYDKIFSCATPAPGGTGTVNCTTRVFYGGDLVKFILLVRVDDNFGPETNLTNTFTVGASAETPDPNPTDNSSSITTTVVLGKTRTVTRTDDRNNATCAVGDCSLREAINAANAASDADKIEFSPLFDSPQTITLTNGVLYIVNGLTINGKGANLTTVSGNNASRVFSIHSDDLNMHTTISGLTIANGNSGPPQDAFGVRNGGGMENQGAGEVNLINCAFTNNTTAAYGGAVYRGYFGIWNITGCTFSGNKAYNGGAFYQDSNKTNISNTTISGNTTTGTEGGAIFNRYGDLTITNSTITGNTSNGSGGTGGVYQRDLSPTVKNSIVAGNSGTNPDLGSPDGFVSGGHNFIGKSDGSTGFVNGINGDQVGTIASPKDPLLSLLADNGGPTRTHALLPGSPAIDAGNTANAPPADQRGTARVGAADIGAFEFDGPSNTAPTATIDAYSIGEDALLTVPAAGVLGNDTDAESNALTAVVQTSPANASSFMLNANGSFSYTPTANFNGTDSFTYRANDGSLNSGTVFVTITVTAVNDAPTTTTDTKSTNEDTTLVFNAADLTANDSKGPANESGQTLTVSTVTPTNITHGTVSLINGRISYQPAANYNGAASFDYQVCDNGTTNGSPTPLCAVGMVNVTVSPVNDAPTAAGQSVTTDEDTGKQITLSGSDVDGNALTYIAGSASHGIVSCTGATCTYTPTANYHGSDSFTFKVNDGVLESVAATVSITVIPVNDPPTATVQSVTTDEDTQKSITLAGNDPDGASTVLTYVLVASPSHGSISCTGASCTYTPATNYNGPDSFTFRVNDGSVNSEAAAVSITVTAVNDAPTANPQSVSTNEDTSKGITLLGSDVDGNALTYLVVTGPTHGTFANGVYTPAANYYGPDSFTFKASDGNLNSAPATISITVISVNDAPAFASIAPLSQTIDYSDAIAPTAVTVGDADNAAGSLVVTPLADLPADLALEQTPGTGNWTISGVANLRAGNYTIDLKVTDPSGAFAAGTQIVITVTKEKTAIDYSGDFDLMTSGPTITNANVRLAANLIQQTDNSPGDITKATVTFKIYKFSATDPTYVIPGVSVGSNGEAQFAYTLPADIYNIRVEVDGGNEYWIANQVNDGMLNITVPTNSQRASGGGWVPDATSASGKARFAFSVTGTKSGQPKGSVSFSYKGPDGFTYLVKSNSWQNGYMQFSAEPGVSPTAYTVSNLKGSCNVQKIDLATGQVVESFGGYTFEIFARDGGLLNPRQLDSYSITVWTGTKAVFHQVGSQSSLIALGGGNITNKAK